MYHLPFVFDGILLLIFLVGWLEATGFTFYRWGWRRFLRALSLPLFIGVAGHVIAAGRPWELLLAWNSSLQGPLVMFGFGALVVLMVIGPVWIIDLTGFVVAQFTASSDVTTVVLGNGAIVFAASPADEQEK